MSWLHAVLDVPDHLHAAAADFWARALGWPVGAPWPGHPELQSFEPGAATAYLHLQRIDGPPRVHLDLESDDRDGAVGTAVSLGAELVAERDRWTTLRSPGGLPFCVLTAREHASPEPATWPGGHRARMVQVCVDSPRSAHDREVEFWRRLLAGRWVDSGAPEFAGKWHDDAGSPLQRVPAARRGAARCGRTWTRDRDRGRPRRDRRRPRSRRLARPARSGRPAVLRHCKLARGHPNPRHRLKAPQATRCWSTSSRARSRVSGARSSASHGLVAYAVSTASSTSSTVSSGCSADSDPTEATSNGRPRWP